MNIPVEISELLRIIGEKEVKCFKLEQEIIKRDNEIAEFNKKIISDIPNIPDSNK